MPDNPHRRFCYKVHLFVSLRHRIGTDTMIATNHPWRQTLRNLRRAILPLALYDLIFKILAAVALTPLFAVALDRLIETNGSLAVTNNDIAGFLVSPLGLIFLLCTIAFTFTAFFAEQAGLMLIAGSAVTGRSIHWLDALYRTLAQFPKLLGVAAAQALKLLLVLLPLAGIGAMTFVALLTEHDINWYLTERPPEFWTAVTVGVVLALIAAVSMALMLVRWSLAVPVCLHEEYTGFRALARSRELVHGNRWRIAWLVLGWILFAMLGTIAVLTVLHWAGGLLLYLFSGIKAQILVTALFLGLLTLTGALLSFVAFAGYSIVIDVLYHSVNPNAPEHPDVRQPPTGPARRIGIHVLMLALLASAGMSFAMTSAIVDDLQVGRKVLVTAHRGSSIQAPENSLSAIRQAIEDGADFAEIDVQETRDGVLVLLHDTDLMRIAGLPKKIWEVDYAEIKDLDAGSWFSDAFADERIPTLAQTIDLAKDQIRLNIELKYNGHDQDLAGRVARLVKIRTFEDRCIITSLDYKGLMAVRAIDADLRLGLIVTVAMGDVSKLQVDLLSVNREQATPAQVRTNRSAGLETHVWTVNDREDMVRMIERGVDNVITDEPSLLREVITERAELSDAELLLLSLGARLKE